MSEESLDPQDWTHLRTLGHRMLDDMLDHLAGLRDKPVWRSVPDAVQAALREPLPHEGQSAQSVYEEFRRNVMPYPNGNLHPRFFGWVQGSGTPLGMLADMLAAGLNPMMAGFQQAPVLVEHQVLAWLTELMGLPANSSGVLAGSGTMANVLGLAVARQARAGFNVREEGLQDISHPRLVVYCSTETHGWSQKAMELMGLGNRALRRVAVDADFRISISALREAIAADRKTGHRPIAVIANAGTVNTGAIDDLTAIAELCAEEGLWFHVDGAFGALVRLSPALQTLVAGIERADSLAFDLHKWVSLPFECACVLVRDAKAHHDAFALAPSYMAAQTRGAIAWGLPFSDRGIDLTRNFKALKAWMCLKTYGVNKLGRLIEQNVRQAQQLGRLVEAHPSLELLAPVSLNIVCFRYAPPGAAALDDLNREILFRLQESGVAMPSSTVLHGRFALRAAIVNHRTRMEDVDALVAEVVRIGESLSSAVA